MKKLSSSSTEEAVQLALKLPTEQLEQAVSAMNEDQISLLVNKLHNGNKLKTVIAGLKEASSLESVGKALNAAQLQELLDSILTIGSKYHWKLTPILVGLSHSIFFQIVLFASDKQIVILKHEGMTEAVGHHLTTLCHDLNQQFINITTTAESFEKELISLDISKLDSEKLSQIIKRIEQTSNYLENLYGSANRSLELAWNSDRSDLIETLNMIKDGCQKYSMLLVGTPRTSEEAPTGLYLKLENRFESVFGKPNDTEDVQALRDSEPAYEALVKFRIWYLRDLKDVGLLPKVKNVADLDKKDPFYREKLFLEAKSNLEKSGLKTVADLKKALIFSRDSLKEYIGKHFSH